MLQPWLFDFQKAEIRNFYQTLDILGRPLLYAHWQYDGPVHVDPKISCLDVV